ncbi:hypothetical protein VSF3289_03587 [Vibrio scophthalmi]|uniref:Uncharacterized protein n=1 Tax=Vibrio scophthalmi TaxID=45658 RepID=A0A1E3WF51_9VIBR|nr:hypothetical protein VSF3289_03587 [Vibrio scophthalmi]
MFGYQDNMKTRVPFLDKMGQVSATIHMSLFKDESALGILGYSQKRVGEMVV